jgi:hypothetical protein
MKLNVNQFDDGGGDYLPANPTSSESSSPAAPTAAASGYVNTNTAEGVAAASAAPAYKEPGKGAGMSSAKTKAPKAIDKSAWDRSTKVSQSMVDYVKSEGRGNMGAVPQKKVKEGAPGDNGSTFDKNAPVGAEYKEAVKRIYPNGAPAAKAPAKSPTFNESSPNAKAYPKVAAPKSSKATIRAAENKEITEANKKAPIYDQVAASITNSLKAYPSLVGLSGTTPKNYQITGTQTKTQKAQAERKAERAAAVKAAAAKKNK